MLLSGGDNRTIHSVALSREGMGLRRPWYKKEMMLEKGVGGIWLRWGSSGIRSLDVIDRSGPGV